LANVVAFDFYYAAQTSVVGIAVEVRLMSNRSLCRVFRVSA